MKAMKKHEEKSVNAEQNAEPPDRMEDRIRCPGGSYLITRAVCRGRRERDFRHCRRCPENSDQLELFATALQVERGGRQNRARS